MEINLVSIPGRKKIMAKRLSNSYLNIGKDWSDCISNENKRFAHVLEENHIKVSYEYPIAHKSYDLFIPNRNCLIEIDPTYTHNSTNRVILKGKSSSKAKSKYYHYNKTKLALEKGFYCLHKFDWVKDRDMINLIRTIYRYKLIQEPEPRLHYYNPVTKDHIEDFKQLLDERSMTNRGYVKIWDDGSNLTYHIGK